MYSQRNLFISTAIQVLFALSQASFTAGMGEFPLNAVRHRLYTVIDRHYAACFRPESIVPVDSSHSFSGAELFRIETPSGSFCLRGWPPNSLPLARIRGLHRLLQHLFVNGMTQVAVPLRTITGMTTFEWENRLWHLEPWMPGVADFRRDPRPEKLAHAMTALADWHRAATSWIAPDDCSQWFGVSAAAASPAARERLARFNDWDGDKVGLLHACIDVSAPSLWCETGVRFLSHFKRLAKAVRDELQQFERVLLPLQPCLRDIWSEHVLFTGTNVTGLIDPTACRMDHVALDLARLLGSLLDDDIASWKFALESYRQHHPLTDTELEYIRVLDRSSTLLSGMTWLERYFLRSAPIRHQESAYERLVSLTKRIETMRDESRSIISN